MTMLVVLFDLSLFLLSLFLLAGDVSLASLTFVSSVSLW